MTFDLTLFRMLISKLLFVGLLCLWAIVARAVEDRILLDATINNKPIRLVFDTGASDLILFKQGAERLGLKVTEPPRDLRLAPGEVAVGTTEECDFVLGSTRARTSLKVFEPPSFLRTRVDGAVGWRQIRYNTIQIDAGQKTATWLDKAPAETSTWLKFRIRSQARILSLEIPDQDKKGCVLTVDTGSFCGVAMSPQRWQAWKAAHTNEPATLIAGYMPGAGTVVAEENWARELTFGPLILTEVPVMPANVAEQAMGTTDFEVSFGLAALSRMDLIIDGNLGIAYLRPKQGPPPPYQHNRLGAVFAPSDLQGVDLVARVIQGSPAYEAGIRNGDVLLKVGDLDTTQWRTDPNVLPLSRFWEDPPSTKLNLTLKRGSETLMATPVLRQILGPVSGPSAKVPEK
jgi:hypothetical protein